MPAGPAVTLAPLVRHGNLCQHLANVVVQGAHRRFPLPGRGEGASGSASMRAMCWRTAAKFSSDESTAGATSFIGLRSLRLLRFLCILHFLSWNVIERR